MDKDRCESCPKRISLQSQANTACATNFTSPQEREAFMAEIWQEFNKAVQVSKNCAGPRIVEQLTTVTQGEEILHKSKSSRKVCGADTI